MKLGGGPVNLSVEGEQLEQVSEFRYLGCNITDNSERKKEIRSRLAMGSAVVSRLSEV